MPNIFDSAWDQYNRGWQQLYGAPQSAVPVDMGPLASAPYAYPSAGSGAPVGPPESPAGALAAPAQTLMVPAGATPYVGAPMGSPDFVSDPSVLNGDQGLAASGEGRSNLSQESPNLLNIGGYTGSIGSAISNTLGGLTSYLGSKNSPLVQQQGGTPGTPSAGGGYVDPTTGYYIGASPGTGQSGYAYPSQANAAAAGDTGSGVGGGGMTGLGTAAGGAAASTILSFGKQVAADEAPVTVNPAAWAGPIPQGFTFVVPKLSPNAPVAGGF
jgi:hypothetical protein